MPISRRAWICAMLAAGAGGFATFIDMYATDVQAAVAVLLVMGIPLGFAEPRRWRLCGIVASAMLPITYLVAEWLRIPIPNPPQPNAFASALAIVPALIATGAGAWLG